MSLEKKSFITGILYVSLAVLGPIGFLILPEQFQVINVNDFVTTNMGLVGVWVIVDLMIVAIEIVITIFLLHLFNTYNKTLSFIAFVFRMIMTSIMVVNAIFLFIVLVGSNVDAARYFQYHSDGIYVWQVFFSVHVFLLGYMLFKNNPSNWRYLGVALILGALGYLLDSIINLSSLDIALLNVLSLILLIFVTIGELGMAVALIMKKVILVKAVQN